MKCDQCVLVRIQGQPCHEHGCPNAGPRREEFTERHAAKGKSSDSVL